MLNGYQEDYREYQDYRVMAECGQEFEGLMPKLIEKLGGIGGNGKDVSLFAQGVGVTPMEVVDVDALANGGSAKPEPDIDRDSTAEEAKAIVDEKEGGDLVFAGLDDAEAQKEVIDYISTKSFKNLTIEDVELKQEEGKSITLKADEEVVLDGITVCGEGSVTGTHGTILFVSDSLVLNDITVDPESQAYNAFEGSQTVEFSNIEASNIQWDCPSTKHNIISVYKPADGAKIVVKDSYFHLDADNSNIVRLSNLDNVSDVEVVFENVNIDYDNDKENSYAGFVIYQAFGSDEAYKTDGNLEPLKSWKFKFKNCKFNGEKVTEVNFGQLRQVAYGYDIRSIKTGTCDLSTLCEFTFE